MTEEEKKRRLAEITAARDKALAAGEDAVQVRARFNEEKAALDAEFERDK